MATQITFTDDVQNVSYATNDDATIKWYVYERRIGGTSSIFVQRDAGSGLEAEVEILVEGSLPKITFDPTNSKWIILYTLNENVFFVTFDEAEVPSTQPPQVGDTSTDHLRTGGMYDEGGDIGGSRTLGQRIKTYGQVGVKLIDAYNGPGLPPNVEIGASPIPSRKIVRWRAKPGQFPLLEKDQKPIRGFRAYRRRGDNGQFEELAYQGRRLPVSSGSGFDPRNIKSYIPLNDPPPLKSVYNPLLYPGTLQSNDANVVTEGPSIGLPGPSFLFPGVVGGYMAYKSQGDVWTDLSFSFWIEWGELDADFENVLGKFSSSSFTNRLLVGKTSSGGAKWFINVNNTNYISTTVVAAGVHHVAGTIEQQGPDLDFHLYLNGAELTLPTNTQAGASLLMEDLRPWIIGADLDTGGSSGDYLSNGTKVQDIGIWKDRVLTLSEIQDICTQGLAGNPLPGPEDNTPFISMTGIQMLFRGDLNERWIRDIVGDNHGTFSEELANQDYGPPGLESPGIDGFSTFFDGNETLYYLTDMGMQNNCSFHVMIHPVQSKQQGIFGKHSSVDGPNTNGHNLLSIWVLGDDSIEVALHGDPGIVLTAPGSVPIGVWTALCITIAEHSSGGSLVRIYLNGELRASQVTQDRLNGGPQPFTGGNSRPWALGFDWDDPSSRNDYFHGFIQDLVFFDDRVLTQAEAKVLSDMYLSGIIPFVGLDPVVYELEVDAVPGTYYVKQENFAGPHSTRVVSDRIPGPGARLLGDGNTIEDVVVSVLHSGLGDGRQSNLLLDVVETRPVVIIPPVDQFLLPAIGSGDENDLRFRVDLDKEEGPVMVEESTFLLPTLGRGRVLKLSQTGFGSVIIT